MTEEAVPDRGRVGGRAVKSEGRRPKDPGPGATEDAEGMGAAEGEGALDGPGNGVGAELDSGVAAGTGFGFLGIMGCGSGRCERESRCERSGREGRAGERE